jgi:tetratricopeptide (TPR) repeat protein
MQLIRPKSEDDLDVILRSSKALASAGKFDEALAVCNWLIDDPETEVAGLRQRAALKQLSSDFDGSIQDLHRVVALFPHEPADFYTLGIQLLRIGATSDAIVALTNAIRADNEAASDYYTEGALFFRAVAHLKMCDYKEAISDISIVRSGFKTYVPNDGMRTREQVLDEAEEALSKKKKFQFRPSS